jgi:formate--tetrahydrofolate ligase
MAKVKSDIEIAREADMKPIKEIAAKIGIKESDLIPYGHTKAKVSADFIKSIQSNEDGNLILVTAINPTPAGEGKTTTTVGLGDGLNAHRQEGDLHSRSLARAELRHEGRRCRRRHAQVVPMEDMNLHFTGDFHAITSAHNLLSAMIDNHIYWGNELDIDLRRVHGAGWWT